MDLTHLKGQFSHLFDIVYSIFDWFQINVRNLERSNLTS